MPNCQWSFTVYTREDNDLVIDRHSKKEIHYCERTAEWIIFTNFPSLPEEAALACTEHVGQMLRHETGLTNRVEPALRYLQPGGFIEEYFHVQSI